MNKIDVLLLSDSKDFTTDYISYELEKIGANYLRIDRDLLHKYELIWNINDSQITIKKNNLKFSIDSSIKSIYYRAPTYLRETFIRKKSILAQLKQSQWISFYRNLVYFKNAKWMNNPVSTYYAENKLVQLKEAQEIGFNIPKTILTNTKNQIDLSEDKVVIKSLDTAIFFDGNHELFVYTNIINSKELEKSELAAAPVIIQQLLEPKIDYRVTVIDESVYAVKILKNGNGIIGDWRKEKNNVKFIATDLPLSIENKCKKITKNLGLIFGAIDLVYSNNTFYFIEINPTGEWAWLVDSANQKIYEDICFYLTK